MNEFYFRLAFGVLVISTASVAMYYKRKAAVIGDVISYHHEGRLYYISLRLAAGVLWLSTLAYLFAPWVIPWAAVPIPSIVRWFAFLTGLGCSVLMAWTLSSLGTNLTDTVVTRNQATLITNGPYRWVRHPYYVITALLMFAVTILTANWLIGISSVVVIALLAYRTPQEEQMLIERFGESYKDYINSTGRYFPRWR